jgi:hypothetical protein
VRIPAALVLLLAGCGGGGSAAVPDRDYWVETAAKHGFTSTEIGAVLGGGRVDPPAVTPPAPFTILPYPGGRHPRLGFLEGAVDPHRDTKFSLFLPGGGYVVVDFPEAVWVAKDLVYLAHTHIPTLWDRQGVKLPRLEWTRKADGSLEERRVLPDGVEIFARAKPSERGVDLELRIKNGSTRTLTGLRSQVCVLLRGAPGFDAQSKDNKVLIEAHGVAAVRSAEGRRWIATVFTRGKTWQNPPCPCIHSDPTFPDLPPGAEAGVRGRVFWYEGSDFAAEVGRRAAAGTLLPP